MKRHSNKHETKYRVRAADHKLNTKVTEVNQKAEPLVSRCEERSNLIGINCANASILIVDDELDVARVLEKMLKKKGYKIQVAFDGLEALKKLHRNHFELVITDLLMPRLDGMRLLKKIREKWPTLPVMVITAVGDEQLHHKLLSMGVSAYLRKPFERKQLFDAVAEIIQTFTQKDIANNIEGTEGLTLVGAYR